MIKVQSRFIYATLASFTEFCGNLVQYIFFKTNNENSEGFVKYIHECGVEFSM